MTFAYTPKEGNINVILGPFVQKTNFQGSDSGAKASYLTGTGLIAQGDINDYSSLEIAMFYMPKIFIRDQVDKFLAERTQVLYVTMGYRYWLSPYFTAALAFFSSYTMGEKEVVHNDFPAGTDIDTSARDTTEYGFDFSLQQELWGNDRYAVITDARYSLSVTSKTNERGDHYGFLIGLKYFIQGK